jgi:hypothetical protein
LAAAALAARVAPPWLAVRDPLAGWLLGTSHRAHLGGGESGGRRASIPDATPGLTPGLARVFPPLRPQAAAEHAPTAALEGAMGGGGGGGDSSSALDRELQARLDNLRKT